MAPVADLARLNSLSHCPGRAARPGGGGPYAAPSGELPPSLIAMLSTAAPAPPPAAVSDADWAAGNAGRVAAEVAAIAAAQRRLVPRVAKLAAAVRGVAATRTQLEQLVADLERRRDLRVGAGG
ncbi:hypothetical protein I4F81_003952 [Pyropia yezoensis]|uniref:Uncharacterized protein n=1 Tax=Pyropia yezoensis TaxID=2788 RepID=A0ACC3BTY3_PYRYE|nr:hypothetical protein I4F81_003952 [Neopyropia yezoensis]